MDTQLSTFPHRLELDRAPVAEGRVPATAIVERQVAEHIQPCLFAGRIATPIHAFDFERMEKTLNTSIVPAISLAAHAHGNTMLLHRALMVEGAVLAAAIRVMEQPRLRFTAPQRHGQRIIHEIAGHSLLEAPAHDHPRVKIEHHGQIQPALVGPQVRDVSGFSTRPSASNCAHR